MTNVSTAELGNQIMVLEDGDQLAKLEGSIRAQEVHRADRFNIFDVLQVTRLELPHSNVLAFLLSPGAKHGLGDAFTKAFLAQVISPEFAEWDLTKLEVYRERHHIDILLVDKAHSTVVAIENKIDSGEHGNQLDTYWEVLGSQYPDMVRFGLFLTPGRFLPSSANYKSIDYNLIADVLDRLLQSSTQLIEPAVRFAIGQYVEMLRRHIVNDLEVSERCLDIYRKYHTAIDRIEAEFQAYLGRAVRTLKVELEGLIGEQPQYLVKDEFAPYYYRFAAKDWDRIPDLNISDQLEETFWTPSGRLLMFVFANTPGSLELGLHVFSAHERTRVVIDKLLIGIRGNSIFNTSKNLKWHRLYNNVFLNEEDYKRLDESELLDKVRQKWRLFLQEDFEQIRTAIQSVFGGDVSGTPSTSL